MRDATDPPYVPPTPKPPDTLRCNVHIRACGHPCVEAKHDGKDGLLHNCKVAGCSNLGLYRINGGTPCADCGKPMMAHFGFSSEAVKNGAPLHCPARVHGHHPDRQCASCGRKLQEHELDAEGKPKWCPNRKSFTPQR